MKIHLPHQISERNTIGNVQDKDLSYLLSQYLLEALGFVCIIVENSQLAYKLEQELKFYLNNDFPILHFPDWETLPFDTFSPHQDILSERLKILYKIPLMKQGVLLVPVATMLHKLCPLEYINQNTLLLKKADLLHIDSMRLHLEKSGYRCVPQVMECGEFSVRGSIIDLYPTGSTLPFRIDLFDNEVDSIRTFDVNTQRSLDIVNKIELLPAREFPLHEAAISLFRNQWRAEFSGDASRCVTYVEISEGHSTPGIEYYLPLFFEETSNLFEYFPENTVLIKVNDIEGASRQFWEEINHRCSQYGHDITRPLLNPAKLFFTSRRIF